MLAAMSTLGRLVAPISRLRARWRFARWVWRTRFVLARHGCKLEVHAPHGATFDSPPAVRPTLHFGPVGGGGRVRIELGRWVHLGRDMEIEVLPSEESTLVLGDGVTCQANVRLVLFGGEIRVGPSAQLRDGAMLKSSGSLVLGERVMVARFSSIQAHDSVRFEDLSGAAERVTVIDSDHTIDGTDDHFLVKPVRSDPITVGRNTWLGANVVVLRGARIGRNALVGAASVVRGGDYPDGWLIAGVPAAPVRPLGRRQAEVAGSG